MRFREQLPTYENILKTYLEDMIGRNKDLFYFTGLLNDIEGGCSIALDSYWGSGKTFFVKQAKMLFEAYNDSIEDTGSILFKSKEEIKNKREQFDKKELKQIFCVYYDAWKNDGDADPALSLIYEMVKQQNLNHILSDGSTVEKLAGIFSFFSGISFSSKLDDIKSLLGEMNKQKEAEGKIDDFFESIFFTNNRKLIVFIDELDRCTPTFAVKLLERINHYFINDSIIFVFSVNLTELQHTVKKYYGENISASRYLDRFFDLRISLPPIELDSYLNILNFNNTRNRYETVCKEVIKELDFEIREIYRFVNLAKLAAYKPTHSDEYHLSGEGKATDFILKYVLPVALGLKVTNLDAFNDFISGKNGEILCRICANVNIDPFVGLLCFDESYESFPNIREDKVVKLADKIEEVYKAIFAEKYNSINYAHQIGTLVFTEKSKNRVLEIISVLSRYADVNYDKKPEESE